MKKKNYLLVLSIVFILITRLNICAQSLISNYNDLFAQASNEFNVPVNLLKGIAYEETRWQHLIWSDNDTASSCNGLPRVYGIMGLWDNDYFGHSLRDAARLIGKLPHDLKLSPFDNIRGAAALLRNIYDENIKFPDNSNNSIEGWNNALAKFSGYPQVEIAYQRAYDIYELIFIGYNKFGIKIEAQKINMNLLQSHLEELKDKVKKNPKTTLATPDYPLAVWNPASSSNYSTTLINHYFVVVHDIEGTYLSCISWFKNPAAQVSAHYVLNAKKDIVNDSVAGQVTQMVEERYRAWHVGCWNSYMIGLEHEGYANTPAWYTPELYNSSANLIKYICDKYSIPKDRYHIIAHSEWQNTNWKNWMNTNFASIDPTCNTHTDPGIFWKWDSLMAAVTSQNKEVISGFEFVTSPWWNPTTSGSTFGVSKNSSISQSAESKKGGTYSGKLILIDSSQTSNWFVRVYNDYISKDTIKVGTDGYIRIYLKSSSVPSGIKVRLAVDDNSTSITEATTWQTVIADGAWHLYEWKINDPSQWDSFSGGNGQIDGPNTYFDSIQFSCNDPNSSSTQFVIYIDNIEKGIQPKNTITLNLTALLEGFYNSSTNNSTRDTITVFLRNTSSPFLSVDSAKIVQDSLGNSISNFMNAPTGLYYIVIKHRNHLETWSRNGGENLVKGSEFTYDFTDSPTKAYGNNLKLKGTKWCIWAGDTNSDQFLDGSDVSICHNDASIGQQGYIITDLNGDNFADGEDVSIVFNNSSLGVGVSHP